MHGNSPTTGTIGKINARLLVATATKLTELTGAQLFNSGAAIQTETLTWPFHVIMSLIMELTDIVTIPG